MAQKCFIQFHHLRRADEVDVVNANGSSSKLYDVLEARALAAALVLASLATAGGAHARTATRSARCVRRSDATTACSFT